MSPHISVALVTYNGQRFIEEQLASIMGQLPVPHEVVIADDGSSDRTREVVESVMIGAPFRARMVGGDHVGLRRNVERAVQACNGAVIALSDQDDIWLPGRLAAIERAFYDPAVKLWFSDADLIDEHGSPLGARLWDKVTLPPEAQRELSDGFGVRRLLHGMTVTGATMAFRASVRSLALPLPTELDEPDLFLHDGWIAVLAALTGRVVADPRCFTLYRQHEQQFTSMRVASQTTTPSRSRGALATRHGIEREHARVRLVLERLVDRGALHTCSQADQRLLIELEDLLRRRAAPAGSRRVSAILSAFRAGQYDRYARGWRTALADLLYPRR
jgi:hypothetical protein